MVGRLNGKFMVIHLEDSLPPDNLSRITSNHTVRVVRRHGLLLDGGFSVWLMWLASFPLVLIYRPVVDERRDDGDDDIFY
jgi:hypothetical protein